MTGARVTSTRTRRARTAFAVAIAAALATACSSGETANPGSASATSPVGGSGSSADCPPAEGAATRTTSFAAPPPTCIDAAKTYTAEVTTSRGSFTVKLDPSKAPVAVNNFVFLARHNYYDGISFHRIIPGFVIQGGDPEGTGSGGPGYEFADELPASASDYRVGTLAMANAGPDTNGSQFFVVLAEGNLEANYSIFGEVTDGLDTTIPAIAATGTRSGTPSDETTITDVVIAEG